MKMKTLVWIAGTVLLLTGCVGLRGGQVEGFGSRSSLEHAAGAHESGEGVRYVTAPTDYGVQGVLGIGGSSGSNSFQGIQLDTHRVAADLGVRVGRPIGPVVVYLGLGGQPEHLRVSDTAGEADSAWALAGYGSVGVDWHVRSLRLGLEYRATSGARFNLLDSRGVDMDDRALMVSVGWGF
jgi:hypothetical protein